jgi:argininosuccinate lyase
VFDAGDTLKQSLQIFSEMLGTLTVETERMEEAAKTGFLNATDAADYLVSKGLPFRDCHEIIGKLVLHCISESKSIESLTLAELQGFSPLFEADVYDKLTLESCINNKRSAGSTSYESIQKQISDIRKDMV